MKQQGTMTKVEKLINKEEIQAFKQNLQKIRSTLPGLLSDVPIKTEAAANTTCARYPL